jgi:D-tyrosyl-tRNA(Tyr) deacylase
MRALLQRVKKANVTVLAESVGTIDQGLVVFLGVTQEDGEEEVRWLANKIASLRIFEDEAGKMNLSVKDVDGEVLVVSQFTLYGDARKGKTARAGDTCFYRCVWSKNAS